MSTIVDHRSLGAGLNEVAGKWGWFVTLGVGLLIAGGVASANLFLATLASILYIAVMMLVGGVMQFVHAFTAHDWKRRVLLVLGGALYALSGAIAVYDPIMASVGISLVVGVLLIAAGAVRIASAVQDRNHKGWGWVAASGMLTLIVGSVVVAAWPAIGIWLLGAILTVDLIFQGWGFIAFGLALRSRAKTA